MWQGRIPRHLSQEVLPDCPTPGCPELSGQTTHPPTYPCGCGLGCLWLLERGALQRGEGLAADAGWAVASPTMSLGKVLAWGLQRPSTRRQEPSLNHTSSGIGSGGVERTGPCLRSHTFSREEKMHTKQLRLLWEVSRGHQRTRDVMGPEVRRPLKGAGVGDRPEHAGGCDQRLTCTSRFLQPHRRCAFEAREPGPWSSRDFWR